MKEAYKELLRRADEWIRAHEAEFISELQGMARIPSVSRADLAEDGAPFGPDCRKMLDYVLERGRAYGFDVQDYDGYVCALSMGDPDNSLGVIAHMDVVPVGEGWVYPPFGATYLPEHNVMIGRGVSDNKGPGVAGLFAMRMLREFGWPLKHGVRLLCGFAEETGMDDFAELVRRGERFPKLSLVPDAGFPVNYAQKGSLNAEIVADCAGNLVSMDAGSVRNIIPDKAECVVAMDVEAVRQALNGLDEALEVSACENGTRIIANGRAGHAASPDSAVNAIHLLAKALTDAKLLEGSCAKAIKELSELSADSYGMSGGVAFEDEVSGKLTLVYSVAHLKDGKLTVSVDCRSSISIDQEWMVATLKSNWTGRGFAVENLSTTRPFYIPKDDSRVEALQELYSEVTGRNDEPYTMGGGTYSRVVPNAITFGPGIPGAGRPHDYLPEGHGGAHGRDELLDLETLHACTKIYAVALAMLDELTD